MLDFSEKLTLTPSAMAEQDIVDLRAHGFTDQDILSIVLAAAYRNYIVRVADALGVELNSTVDYAPELIRAFGVDDRQARTTLYADRLTRTAPSIEAVERPHYQPKPRLSTNGKCWIDTTAAAESSEQFHQAIDELVELSGPSSVRTLAQALALRPDALAVTVEYQRLLGLGGSGLGRRLEAIIGLTVAATLMSGYMGTHHAQWLLETGATPDDIEALANNRSKNSLDQRENEVIRFCERLTRAPATMVRSDVEELRAVGFEDRDIITIAASASLENFICRIADGIGVQLEPEGFAPIALKVFLSR
jgi:uncharacterized peroxidase-related enzyme